MKWKIIVYTIMKNEKHNIDEWLNNISLADGIYVLDTGSTDGSYEYMISQKSKYPQLHVQQIVYDNFRFDVARNDSLNMVPNEDNIICWTIDLDERFENNWYSETLNSANKYPKFYKLKYWYACRHDDFGQIVDKHIYDKCHRRIGASWSRPIHEILEYGDYANSYEDGIIQINNDNILVHHYQDEHERRSAQYINLLKQRIKDDKYDIEAFHHLTTEYGKLGDLQSQIDLMLLQYGRGLLCNCNWMECICGNLAESFAYMDLYEDAKMWFERAINFNPYLKTYYIKYIDFLVKKDLISKAHEVYNTLLNTELRQHEEWKEISEEYCNNVLCSLFDSIALKNYYQGCYDAAYSYGLKALNLDSTNQRLRENLKYYIEKYTQRKGYVTVLSDNSFINGVVALYRSLIETKTIYPFYCMITPEVSLENIEVLRKLNINIIERNPEYYSNKTSEMIEIIETLDSFGWHKAMIKLELFNLTEFDKIVYLDSDMIVHQNIDELFERPHMSAAKDCCDIEGYFGDGQTFNSGLMVIEPNEQEYLNIINHMLSFDSSKQLIHDQLILQTYFSEWPKENQLLHPKYNYWSTYSDTDDIKITHFIDKKPWRLNKDYFYALSNDYPRYVKCSLWYVDYINETIEILKRNNISSEDLKTIL